MGIKLLDGEEVVWKSFPGKRYRTVILFRDLSISFFVALMIQQVLVNLLPDFFKDGLGFKVAAVFFFIGFCIAMYTQINFLLVRYMMTTERIVISKGFLNRDLTSLKYEHILDTKVKQSFADMIIKTGTVFITNANDRADERDASALDRIASFKNIDDPFFVHKTLEEFIEEQQGVRHNKKSKFKEEE